MKEEVVHAKSAYEKPTIEVLGSVAGLTQWNINPNKWNSWADWQSGGVAGGGIGS
jgi:hypothetical protein